MRSGTLATHQIVGMGEAFHLAKHEMRNDNQRIQELHNQLLSGLKELPNFHRHADHKKTVPHILNIGFSDALAEVIMGEMPLLAVSTASACQSKGSEGSHVLRAMGYSELEVKRAIRLSIGRFTTSQEICQVIAWFQQFFRKFT